MLYEYECECGAKASSDEPLKKCSFCNKKLHLVLQYGYRGCWTEKGEDRMSNIQYFYKNFEEPKKKKKTKKKD